jgi:tripartite-type tricarboxylate transporter receptor subunit TctC
MRDVAVGHDELASMIELICNITPRSQPHPYPSPEGRGKLSRFLRPPARALLALTLMSSAAAAQEWPTKQINFIVPFAAGSTPDVMARLISEVMQKRLGQTVIVENRAGAGGNTGTNVIAKAQPDGHTFGISIMGPLVVNPMIMKTVPYDAVKDLTPLSHIASQPGVLVVTPGSGFDTVEALVAKLKADPEKYTYGSIGKGSVSHLAMALIAAKVGAKPAHIPFAGSPPAVTALIRGDVQMAVLPLGAVGSMAQEGKLKLLAVTTPKRSSFFPDVPTLAEKGMDGVEADAWTGMVAPPGIDPKLLAKINAAVKDALADSNVIEKLKAQFIEPVGTAPDAFGAMLAAERARWEPVIKAHGITAE